MIYKSGILFGMILLIQIIINLLPMHLQDSQGIFIVEDNLLYQQMIARELESFGGQLFFYTTGEHCIANLCRRPSIVVLDYNLDGEINGLETLEEIRKFDPSIFVVLFSSQKDVYSSENRSVMDLLILSRKRKVFFTVEEIHSGKSRIRTR